MRVLFATAELAPLARVGGLAEAASGLVRALRTLDVEVDVVLPDYSGVALEGEVEVPVSVPWWVGAARVRRGNHPLAGPITLVEVEGIGRPHPYVDERGAGWPDNDHRFMAFSAVVAALARADRPDVLHLNDWHTAAVAGLLDDPPPTVLTIHTLGYQGVMDAAWLAHLAVGTERFQWYGGVNPLAGAIETVDRVIAVSPNYAAEIVTPEAGMGLHERLAALGHRLVGIRNGIDTTVWHPADDPHLAANYDAGDLTARRACRTALMGDAGWEEDRRPVAAMVTRLVEQKGVDLLLDAVPFLARLPLRLAVLGSGDAELTAQLQAAAVAQPDLIWFTNGYDEPLAHRLFAGADLFVMPSRFEPCGLAQMQAMTYGAPPVVTDVGGLHDTVIDVDTHRQSGTGVVSASVDAAGLVDALHRAVRAIGHPARRAAIQRRGMAQDWSWANPARRHLEVYREAIDDRR
ncbi:MAG: glycogen/starch synthase [Actinomycetota bacterium]